MLNFYNKKIMLDVCMDCEGFEYLTTGHPICDSFTTLKNILHEVDIDTFKVMTAEVLMKNKHTQVTIDFWQFCRFVDDWFRHSSNSKRLLPNWNVRDWLIDYFQCNYNLFKGREYYCGQEFENDQFTYHEDFAMSTIQQNLIELKDTGLRDTDACIIFDDRRVYEPEFSWQVEDFLANKLENKPSKYWHKIEPVLRANLRNFQHYTGLHSVLDNSLINVPEKLTALFEKDIIHMNSEVFEEVLLDECAIYLFQTPYMFHTFDTNFIHIQKCLAEYRRRIND